MKELLSERAKLIDASGIRKVFALAATMTDPVNFSIGQPDFDVPAEAKSAAIKAIEEGFNSYSQTAGEEALTRKLTQAVKAKYGWEEPSVLVTSGVSGGLLLAFMALIDPGDEVIIPDPYFVIYKHIVRMLGGVCVFVDTYPDFGLSANKVRSAISEKTKLIIINSPVNPTGIVYSAGQIKEVVEVAAANDVIVLSDEIYEHFCYDGPYPSVASYYDKTLLLKGFGKTYAMTGWRMGYAAGTGIVKQVIEQMTKIQQYTFVCAPRPFQKASVAAMDCDMSGHVAEYRQKRDMIYDGLKDKYELVRPGGAFYAFVKAPGWAGGSSNFVRKAIENNLLIIPGSVFSERDSHFRISYATSDEKIERGIQILRSLSAEC